MARKVQSKPIVLPTRKICILGTTPSRGLAPFHDPSWEMWTIGPGGSDTPGMRWERIFEVHGPATWPRSFRHHVSQLAKSKDAIPAEYVQHVQALEAWMRIHDAPTPEAFDGYLNLLKSTQPPKVVYTSEPLAGCPANVVYPKEAIFRKYSRMWFTSQISYALALALEENVTDLAIYGIDLESGEEYRSQFIGARHFIDLARLANVTLYLPQGCGLLRDPNPYPDCYETDFALAIMAKLDLLRNSIRDLRSEFEARLTDVGRHEGALSATKDILAGRVADMQAEVQRLEFEHARRSRELSQCIANIHRAEGEMGMADFVFSRFVIHGDDPNAILQHQPPR